MKEYEAVDIRLSSLLAWVVPASLGAAAFGSLPTWLLNGAAGLAAEAVAVAIVLAVMLLSGSLSVGAAQQGATPAATMFLGCSLLRMVLCPLLVGMAWWITGLPSKPLAVWMIITYLLCLALEAIWVVRALRKSRQQQAENTTGNREQEGKTALPR